MREHGTRAKYVSDGCRCDDCRAANAAYQAERARRVAPTLVGADTVRRHIRDLRAAGVGTRAIAHRSGVPRTVLQKIESGRTRRVRKETQDRLLAVMPADRAPGARVPAGPVQANVETLLDRGWTKAAISAAIGQGGRALQLGAQWVTAANASAVAALLDQPIPPRRGLRPVTEVDDRVDDEPTLPDDLPAPPAVDLTKQEWRRRAACRMPDVPVDIFFPGRGDGPTMQAALAVCQRCSSRSECLEANLDERDGVWGGTTAAERRRIRRERGISDQEDVA